MLALGARRLEILPSGVGPTAHTLRTEIMRTFHRLLTASAIGGAAFAATAVPALAATSVTPPSPIPAADASAGGAQDATVSVSVSGLKDANGNGYTNRQAVLEQCVPSPKKSADCDAFTQDFVSLNNGNGSNPSYVVYVEPSGINGDNGNITCNARTDCSVSVFERFNDFTDPYDSAAFTFAGTNPIVPESPYTIALPLGGAALLAGAVIVIRRRQSTRAAA